MSHRDMQDDKNDRGIDGSVEIDETLAAPTGPLTSTDDPRLTAYALGEIDPADRTLVETFLAEHPDARAEVSDIQATASMLGEELAVASAPGLTDAQRATIDAAVTGGATPVASGPGPILSFPAKSLAAAAAALMIVVVGAVFMTPEFSPGSSHPHAGVTVADARRPAGTAPLPSEVSYKEGLSVRSRDGDRFQALGYLDAEESRPSDSRMKVDNSLAATAPLGGQGGGGGGNINEARDQLASRFSEQDSLSFDAGDVSGALAGLKVPEGSTGAIRDDESADSPFRYEIFGKESGGGDDALLDGFALADVTVPEQQVAVLEAEEAPALGGSLSHLSGSARGVSGRRAGGDAFVGAVKKGKASGTPARSSPAAPGLSGADPSFAGGDAVALGEMGYVDSAEVASRAVPRGPVMRMEMPTTELNEEQREMLRELGYLGTDTDADGDDARDIRLRYESDARRAPVRNESYVAPPENAFTDPRDEPLSTFGVDVDTASYSNVRRFLMNGQLPPPSAVRLEEMVNAFDLGVSADRIGNAFDERPLAVVVEAAGCPWAPEHRLASVTLQARPPSVERPPANLVFLVDVSGSMNTDDKLPLLKSSMRLLISQLQAQDRVAIVTYSNNSRMALPSTSCEQKDVILAALDALAPGGSTNGEAGLRQAYTTANEHFIKGGVNRIFLATDGDFNVGASAESELKTIITKSARSGVFLTVLGFGTGNLKDSKLEVMADNGNGHYAYIDTLAEGQRVLMEQAGSTLEVVAKDVKLQVEFNPGKVAAYRLLGYENRKLAAQDFNNDRKDAGDIGAGHTVTALYEIVPVGVAWKPHVDPLRYQVNAEVIEDADPVVVVETDELLFVKMRWKTPEGSTSQLFERSLQDGGQEFAMASSNLRFASAVVGFGMLLRDSVHAGDASFGRLAEIAEGARGSDPGGHRAEFVRLVKLAAGLTGR